MKKIISILAICLVPALSAQADSNVGQCVMPKTKIAKDHRLEFKQPVYLFGSPSADANKQLMSTLATFSIRAEKNGFIQLVTVPDYDLPDPQKAAGKVIGWAKLSDFQFQELRNCN